MPEKAPAQNACGTTATGWFNGTHPPSLGESKKGQYCFNYDNNDCFEFLEGKVTNCGDFFVYYLPDIHYSCSNRYCAI